MHACVYYQISFPGIWVWKGQELAFDLCEDWWVEYSSLHHINITNIIGLHWIDVDNKLMNLVGLSTLVATTGRSSTPSLRTARTLSPSTGSGR